MNRKWMWVCALIGAAILMPIGARVRAEDEKGKPELEKVMEQIDKVYKQIGRWVKDPKNNEKALAKLEDMQRLTVQAKGMTPAHAAKVPEAERAKFVKEYRAMMGNMLRQELDLEDQLLEGQNDKAAETVKTLKELEENGHKEFRPKKEGEGKKHDQGG